MRNRILAVVALAATLAACSGSKPTGTTSPTVATTRPTSTGRIAILAPKPGEVVHGTSFDVHVQVSGARIVKEVTTNIRPDTGHVHLSLDGKIVTILAGEVFRLSGLTKGTHVLQAQFVAADHGPFNPRVLTAVEFSVA